MVEKTKYKGIDKIRTGLKLLKKLEKDFPVEGEVPKEVLEKNFELVLEDIEMSLLKSSIDSVPWAGPSLTMVAELYDSLEKAEEVK